MSNSNGVQGITVFRLVGGGGSLHLQSTNSRGLFRPSNTTRLHGEKLGVQVHLGNRQM